MKALPHYLHKKLSPLGHLHHHIHALQRLSQVVQGYLPDHFADSCQVVRYQQGVLVLSLNEQIFQTELRFLKPTLMHQLQQQTPFADLKAIEVIVTATSPPFATIDKTPALTVEARQACDNAASLCQHPGLRQAFARLAQSQPPAK